MTLSLLILCVAAGAGIAFATSAVVGMALLAARQAVAKLTPAAHARTLLGAAVLPMVVSIATMAVALAPSYGFVADHCEPAGSAHGHPHICTAHHVSEAPGFAVALLATMVAFRIITRLARLAYGSYVARATRRDLLAVARFEAARGLYILPVAIPQAFVIGVWRPMVFVTDGLMAEAHGNYARAALAHERAHVSRHDLLRRALSDVALAFHLPGLAGRLAQHLACAQEMAADAEAAAVVGSKEDVAAALVEMTRAQRASLAMTMAFGASNVEARVYALLDARPRRDRLRPAALFLGLLSFCLLLTLGADAVHHGVETMLGLLAN